MEGYLKENNNKLPVKAETPIQTSYHPEIDISLGIKSEDGSYYQWLIGILRWMAELGRINICLKIYMMSSYLLFS